MKHARTLFVATAAVVMTLASLPGALASNPSSGDLTPPAEDGTASHVPNARPTASANAVALTPGPPRSLMN